MCMQYKETQRIHESKKKEKESEKLKLKLAQVCELSFLVSYNTSIIDWNCSHNLVNKSLTINLLTSVICLEIVILCLSLAHFGVHS